MVAKKRSRSSSALITLCLPKNEAPALTLLLAELVRPQFSCHFHVESQILCLNPAKLSPLHQKLV